MQHTHDSHETIVTRVLSCDPDHLIALGHRLKQSAMEFCYPGESVMAELCPGITLLYHPEREFCKPVHRLGDQAPRIEAES